MSTIELHEHSVKNVSVRSLKNDPLFWNLKQFKKTLKIEIKKKDELDMEFDIIGIHCSFVNAFRRVLLAEVPMMAIEKVHIYNNTSIIQDEVLAHRLGLVPLKADPRNFNFRKMDEDEPFLADDTLEFHLKVKCIRNTKTPPSKLSSAQESFKDCKNIEVLSKQIKWVPIGEQSTQFKASDVGPIHDDILLAKLRPGHELDLRLFAMKGIGRDHAKFQPVATASYRLLPEITFKKEKETGKEVVVVGEKAQRLKSSFSPGVIELDDRKGELVAKIVNPRLDSCSRNVFRHDDLKDCVELSRVPDHYIFNIESVGALPPDVLFLESIRVLKDKCNKLLEEIKLKGNASFL